MSETTLERIREELQRLTGYPAEIDRKIMNTVRVEFITDEVAAGFERRAGGQEVRDFLKKHRQQIAYQALRHTFIETRDDRLTVFQNFFALHPDYKEAARILKGLRDELAPEQRGIWREKMEKVIDVMRPALLLKLDDEGRVFATMDSLLNENPPVGLPVGERESVAEQVREAVAAIAPGYAHLDDDGDPEDALERWERDHAKTGPRKP